MARRRKSSSKFLSVSEELRLIKAAQDGDDDARNTLVTKHLAFIRKSTSRHLSRQKMFTVEEMLGEAVIGYMRAIERFDPSRKIRLNTYADYWIRNHLQYSIAAARHPVTIPGYIQRGGPGAACSDEAKAAATAATNTPAYLSALVDDSGRAMDIPQREAEEIDLPFTPDELHDAIAKLNDTEREIVYGRMDGRTWPEIAVKLGFSFQRAQQIHIVAAAKIARILTKSS